MGKGWRDREKEDRHMGYLTLATIALAVLWIILKASKNE